MPRDNFSDATLIVLGHGSTKNDQSSAPVYQHAAELRRRGIFAAVREAFWKQEPQIKTVLAELSAPRIFIAPLFISEGHFSSDIIPRALGFPGGNSKLETPSSKLFFCQPIGTHKAMTEIILARAREVASRFPFPRAPKPAETTLFIAGHGTEQNENSRQAIERQAEWIRGMKEYADAHAVFLEEQPRIEKCYELAGTRNIIVVPFFISDGMHTQEDIPVLLGEPKRIVQERLANRQPTWRNPTERHEKLVWYAAAVGTEPRIADVILERVREIC
ncbi:MAG TPA: CbiX/SirB N-terminal domain-containing protein [Verrucomicrobiae bacterium]|nr:CbiX/SirB N-terminal domain-containing protein [Verrucomicrobiae bacterium]